MQNASLEGDYAKALDIQDRLINVHTAMFCETSPAPVKFAASLLGKSAESVRLPLVAASEEARMTVREALAEAGLLNG
jgi:4-hydroxy-tetrahydrodipicolinate synthase